MKPLILDSALGTELENRGEYLPSFKTSIWSAYSLIHNPDVITQIHIDNIEAGADIITTSNYQATPELLKREPSAPSYDYLAKRAVELCQEAVIKTNTKTKIAGCFPPIHVTFRPDLTSKEKTLRKFYKTLGSIYQNNVDIIICETMSHSAEARSALAAIQNSNSQKWLGWTLYGNQNTLPSGETITEAFNANLSNGKSL